MVDVTRNDQVELTTNNGKHTGKVMYFNKNKDKNDYEIKLKDVTTESGRKIRSQRFVKSQIIDLKTLNKVRNAEDLPPTKSSHWIITPENAVSESATENPAWASTIRRRPERQFYLAKYEIIDTRENLTSTLVTLKSSSQLSVSFEPSAGGEIAGAGRIKYVCFKSKKFDSVYIIDMEKIGEELAIKHGIKTFMTSKSRKKIMAHSAVAVNACKKLHFFDPQSIQDVEVLGYLVASQPQCAQFQKLTALAKLLLDINLAPESTSEDLQNPSDEIFTKMAGRVKALDLVKTKLEEIRDTKLNSCYEAMMNVRTEEEANYKKGIVTETVRDIVQSPSIETKILHF